MKGAPFWHRMVIAAVVVGWVATGAAAETKVTDADRVVANFAREAATVGDGRIRLEVRGIHLDDHNNVDLNLIGFPIEELEDEIDIKQGRSGTQVEEIQGGIIDLLGSYGLGANAEVGFDVPFLFSETEFRAPTDGGPQVGTENHQDIGDVQLYGKFKKSVAKNCSAAIGLEMSLPTGIEDKYFGTGELGFNPFLSTRYQRGRFAFGANVGYFIYTDDVSDVFNYGAEAIVRGSDVYSLRVELRGRLFKDGGRLLDDAQLWPGFDFNLGNNLTIRPTGIANLTDEAIDWGLGLGIAYQFDLAPAGAPPPAPVAQAPPPPPPPPVKKKLVLRGVNFDFDKAEIRSDAKPILDEAARTLKEEAAARISVEGHTDGRGTEQYNEGLSMRRAEAVRGYLADQGIDKGRMSVSGFGESRPVATNDTDDGRAQNRRVELRVAE